MPQDIVTSLDQSEETFQRQGKRETEEGHLLVMPGRIGDKMVKIKVSQTACNIDVEKAVAVNLFHIRFLLQFIVEVIGP